MHKAAAVILHNLLGRGLGRHGFLRHLQLQLGQDELQTLRYAIMLNCSMGADGGHIVTKTRDRKAALKLLMKSMKRHGRPETIVTDWLRSYGAALKDLGRGDDREMGRWLNNRAENSHLPFRRRERAM